jgi:Xaa-Pro dipeptidase
MRSHGIDVLLCFKPQNSFHLSGFNPVIYSHPVIAILPVEADPKLLVHALRDDHARQSTWVEDIRLFGSWSTKKTMGEDWFKALQAIIEEVGATEGTIGIEGDFLPVSIMGQLESGFPNATFVDVAEMIMETRFVKTPEEVELTRAASRIADIGMDAAIQAAAERKSEREISIRAMAAMNEAWLTDYPDYEVADFANAEGGVHNGLWCYCLIGDRIFMNADNPTVREPNEGDLALIIIWTNCNGIHAENERTVAIGEPPEDVGKMYETILEVRRRAQEAIKPNIPCSELYNAAKAVYTELGYEKYLPGRIGHGMGLAPHEHPSIAPNDHTILKPGMVFTFEPNLRIPGTGGMQHSDTVLITEDGYEFLTTTERGFIQL